MNILVCGPTSYFADDVPAHCATCDAPIVHRPHRPPDCVTICESCAAAAVIAGTLSATLHVTAETLREVALFHTKTKGRH